MHKWQLKMVGKITEIWGCGKKSSDQASLSGTGFDSLSTTEELAQLRAWFLEFDWALWDQQLERDVAAGKLDALAAEALRDHAAGKTTPL